MTVVWRINCSKWKTILGIVLWSGATIGLALVMLNVSTHISMNDQLTCFYDKDKNIRDGNNVHCYNDGGIMFAFLWLLVLLGNGGNALAIWYVINRHFNLLKVECTKNEKKNNQ